MLTAKQGLNWNTRDPQFWRSPYARAGFALEMRWPLECCDVAQVRWFQMHVGSRHGVQASIFQMAVVRKSVWLAKPYRSAIRPLGVVAFNWPRKNGFGSISSSCTGIPTELLPMFRSIHAITCRTRIHWKSYRELNGLPNNVSLWYQSHPRCIRHMSATWPTSLLV